MSTSVAENVFVELTMELFSVISWAFSGRGKVRSESEDSSRSVTVMVTRQSPSEVTVILVSIREAALSAETGITNNPTIRINPISTVKIRFKHIPPYIQIFHLNILPCT